MHNKVIAFNNAQRTTKTDFRAGDVVKVHRKIKEGEKERIQIFEGMIIAMKGGQSSSPMMTVRKVSKGGYGVEIIVPVFSPMIEKIELVKRAAVRRSKLYYIRDKAAKALRFKFTDGSDIITEEFSQVAQEEEQKEAEQKELAQQEAQKAREEKRARDAQKAAEKEQAEKEAENDVAQKKEEAEAEKKPEDETDDSTAQEVEPPAESTKQAEKEEKK